MKVLTPWNAARRKEDEGQQELPLLWKSENQSAVSKRRGMPKPRPWQGLSRLAAGVLGRKRIGLPRPVVNNMPQKVKVEIPDAGIEAEGLSVTHIGPTLIMQGKREERTPVRNEQGFYCRLPLEGKLDWEHALVDIIDGRLEVTIPKE